MVRLFKSSERSCPLLLLLRESIVVVINRSAPGELRSSLCLPGFGREEPAGVLVDRWMNGVNEGRGRWIGEWIGDALSV